MSANPPAPSSEPEDVRTLIEVFGGPSSSGFGSAVFFKQPATAASSLESSALDTYKAFVGEKWDRFGPDAWRGAWKLLYTRPAESTASILEELNAITDTAARLSADTLLNGHDQPDKARQALQRAFQHEAIRELRIYAIGDGAAMSGLLVAAVRADDQPLTLVFLMD